VSLPLASLPAASTLWRIHRLDRPALFFSPAPGTPPAGRYDSPSALYRALYAALEFDTAFAETLLRNPARRLVSVGEIAARAVSALRTARKLRLVDLTGPGLSQLGLDARFLSGPYEPCGAAAEAWFADADAPDGLLTPSRFDPSGSCVTLFDRASDALAASAAPIPLADRPREVGAALDRFGKALDPAGQDARLLAVAEWVRARLGG
jgi:RES domain-containing protein